MTRQAPRKWGAFTHLTPYRINNSPAGLAHAARNSKAIDLDVHATSDGVIVCSHWNKISAEGFRDPRGKIKPNSKITNLTWEQVSRLRTSDGDRIHPLYSLLREAAVNGIRVEVEAKHSKKLEKPAVWRELRKQVAALNGSRGFKVQVKTISDLGGHRAAGRRLRAAHKAGITTIVLPRRAKRMRVKFKPFVDYSRGTITWVKPKKKRKK